MNASSLTLLESLCFGAEEASATPFSAILDTGGNSSLHIAAFASNVEEVRQLLAVGCSPNAFNRDGETPLHQAIHGVSQLANPISIPEIVELLLKAGSRANARNLKLYAPLHLVKHYQRQLSGDASKLAALQQIESYLMDNGAEPIRERKPHEWEC